jgi:hypothetical protein
MSAAAFAVLLTGLVPAQASPGDNLNFATGTLAGWRGYGFYVTTADPRGPSTSLGVCSSDRGGRGRKGELRYTFVVPPGAAALQCNAYAFCRRGLKPDDRLDIHVITAENHVLPRRVQAAAGWESAEVMLPRQNGKARAYSWDLSGLVGHKVQIVLRDDDDRPGCHLFCSGFRLTGADEVADIDFGAQMKRLEREFKLTPFTAFESKHFIAWSNADADFTKRRVRNCELIYALFVDHFQRRGFDVQAPPAKLMVAVFDSPGGMEAFLGQKMPSAVTGVYSRLTNQLVLYDLSQNAAVLAHREKALAEARNLRNDQDKLRYLETIHRHASEWSQDGGLSTAMHETAHHLSFNCGLLNRQGDVPVWLAEGLATYCEATDQGGWQGIGEPNPMRIFVLDTVLRRQGKFIPLRALVEDDRWRDQEGAALLGYSQSWALFRMLIQEEPEKLRRYLTLIYARRAPESRLLDFGEVFGANLDRLEQRYEEYMRQLVLRHPPRPR